MPRVSVIIATYNRASLLPYAVNSARDAARDPEIIVVDDASSFETAQVCQNLDGIRYLRLDTNQGPGGARNIGMIASSGEYITFLDDDDVRLNDLLERQVQILDREPAAGMIYGQAIMKGNRDKRIHTYPMECPQGDVFWTLLSRNFIPGGSVVFRRTCLDRVGLLDEDSRGIEDWDLWIRIAELFPVLAFEAPVMICRQANPTSDQLTSRADRIVRLCTQQFRTWMKLPRTVTATPRTRRLAWQNFSENMAEHLIWESMKALQCGKLSQPLKNLAVTPRIGPTTLMRVAAHRILNLARPEIH